MFFQRSPSDLHLIFVPPVVSLCICSQQRRLYFSFPQYPFFKILQLKLLKVKTFFPVVSSYAETQSPRQTNDDALLHPTKRFQCNIPRCNLVLIPDLWVYHSCTCCCRVFHCFQCESCDFFVIYRFFVPFQLKRKNLLWCVRIGSESRSI